MRSYFLYLFFYSVLAQCLNEGCFPMVYASQSSSELSGTGGMDEQGYSVVLIRFSNSSQVKAIVMTTGHSIEHLHPKNYRINFPYRQSIYLYNNRGEKIYLQTSKVIFATTTETDVALIQLEANYSILNKAGIRSFEISKLPAQINDPIKMISGLFKTIQNCKIDTISYELREDPWTFHQSYGYFGCSSEHGTSGSPLISLKTGKIVGINTTRNDDGAKCTGNNPCEVSNDGNITFIQGKSYGQRTNLILSCVDDLGIFNLDLKTCYLSH